MFLKFSDKTAHQSVRSRLLYLFWVTLLINFSISSSSTTKYIRLRDSNLPISHSRISDVSGHNDHGLSYGNATKSRVERGRKVLVYLEGKILCEIYCMSGFNSTSHINPLHGTRVKVECKSSYGEYETVGIANREGIFRIILHGALGYRWPLKFCKTRVLLDTVPRRCRPSRTHARNDICAFNMNVRLVYDLPEKIMLGVGPFILKPTNITAVAPCHKFMLNPDLGSSHGI